MDSQEPVVFTRRSSGLIRTVGAFSALSLVLCHTIGGGINKLMVYASYTSPGANVPLAFLFTGIIAIITAAVYMMLSTAMPRTGGDYIYITRGISPIMGFLASWGFWFTEVLSFGIIAFYDIPIWGLTFQIAGSAMQNEALLRIGSIISAPHWGLWLGFAMVVVFSLVALRGMTTYTKIINWMLVLPAIGSVLMIIFMSKGSSMVAVNWDAVYGSGMYQKVVELSGQFTDVWRPRSFSLAATLLAGVGGIWAYIGVTAAAYVGGEVKNPRRTMAIGLLGGASIIVLYYVFLSFTTYRTFGNFIPMYCNVYKHPEAWQALTAIYPHAPAPYLPTFAAAMAPGMFIVQFIMAISAALWLMNDIPVFFVICSRQVFSWSFDRFFPAKFAEVNPKYHTPHYAILLTLVGGLVGVLVSYIAEKGVVGSWVAAMDTTMLYQFAVTLGCLAAVAIPYIRPDIYERGRKLEIRGIPVMSILGMIGFGFNFWYLFIAGSWLNISRDLLVQSGWMFVGVVIFLGYYASNTKKGIDVRSIYQQVPPA